MNKTGLKLDDISETILKTLNESKSGLSKDSLAAIIALKSDMHTDMTLISLLESGKIIAKYGGDKSQNLLLEDFTFEIKEKKSRLEA